MPIRLVYKYRCQNACSQRRGPSCTGTYSLIMAWLSEMFSRHQCQNRVAEHYGHLSKYQEMILDMNENIPTRYFVLAGFFSWLLLAGFVVSPSTFASIQSIESPDEAGEIGRSMLRTIKNLPLFILATSGCLVAFCGMVFCWLMHGHNHVWTNRCLVMFVRFLTGSLY